MGVPGSGKPTAMNRCKATIKRNRKLIVRLTAKKGKLQHCPKYWERWQAMASDGQRCHWTVESWSQLLKPLVPGSCNWHWRDRWTSDILGNGWRCHYTSSFSCFLGTKRYVDRQWTWREAKQAPGHKFHKSGIRSGTKNLCKSWHNEHHWTYTYLLPLLLTKFPAPAGHKARVFYWGGASILL